jgi:hypothetical protein
VSSSIDPSIINSIIKLRAVSTDVLAARPDLLDNYPYRYILVQASLHVFSSDTFSRLFWAVEMLESRGWELAGWKDRSTPPRPALATPPGAFMRRTAVAQAAT